eukprot:3559062-Pleurochrysis_carterae.AAC.2
MAVDARWIDVLNTCPGKVHKGVLTPCPWHCAHCCITDITPKSSHGSTFVIALTVASARNLDRRKD